MSRYRETLRGHGHPIFQRDGFRCIYCGFDGRDFLSWHQLSIDHIIPRSAGGTDTDTNLATCCNSCNSITSRMKFEPGVSREKALAEKRARVLHRHQMCLDFWRDHVSVQSIERTAPGLNKPLKPTGNTRR